MKSNRNPVTVSADVGKCEVSNVELIGFIVLLLSKIEAQDDDDTSTLEDVYEYVLKAWRQRDNRPEV